MYLKNLNWREAMHFIFTLYFLHTVLLAIFCWISLILLAGPPHRELALLCVGVLPHWAPPQGSTGLLSVTRQLDQSKYKIYIIAHGMFQFSMLICSCKIRSQNLYNFMEENYKIRLTDIGSFMNEINGKMLLVRIIENFKLFAYFRWG